VIHCLVSYGDGTTLAHMSAPDMRTPISYALAWPRRIASPSKRLDLAAVGQLTFQEPDHQRFRCLGLALESMRLGGVAPTILNAANEIAVAAFLDGKIGFLDIPRIVEDTLSAAHSSNAEAAMLDGVLAADERARATAGDMCRRVVV
jgi:1-deoxy-D-xylulose-5-phosphate reductoisomerase